MPWNVSIVIRTGRSGAGGEIQKWQGAAQGKFEKCEMK